MNVFDIRIAVNKLMGATGVLPHSTQAYWSDTDCNFTMLRAFNMWPQKSDEQPGKLVAGLVCFDTSLDACAYFIRKVQKNPSAWRMYGHKLVRIVCRDLNHDTPCSLDSDDWINTIGATPLQHCECYCRLEGVWIE